MNLTMGILVGSRPISARECAKIVVEGAILFDHDYNMFYRIGSLGNCPCGAWTRYWNNADEHKQNSQNTSKACLLCCPESLPKSIMPWILLVHSELFQSNKLQHVIVVSLAIARGTNSNQ